MRTIQREIVGAFIFSSDGYMLLGKSQPGGVYPGYLLVPGGGIEPGETLIKAIKREVQEEVNFVINNEWIQLVNTTQSGTSEKTLRETGERVIVEMHFNDFRIDIPSPAASISAVAGDDFGEIEWIPLDKLPYAKLAETTKGTLRKLGYLD